MPIECQPHAFQVFLIGLFGGGVLASGFILLGMLVLGGSDAN